MTYATVILLLYMTRASAGVCLDRNLTNGGLGENRFGEFQLVILAAEKPVLPY